MVNDTRTQENAKHKYFIEKYKQNNNNKIKWETTTSVKRKNGN